MRAAINNRQQKKRFEVTVTSYGRNKNLDKILKNQEKANNSRSYRLAAIKKDFSNTPPRVEKDSAPIQFKFFEL